MIAGMPVAACRARPLPPSRSVDDRDRREPGAHRREPGRRRRLATGQLVDAVGAAEARGDRRQHQDRLEALAEYEDRAVDHRGGAAHVAGVCGDARIGRAAARVPPKNYGHRRHTQRQCTTQT